MYLERLPKDVEFEAVSVDSFHAIKSHVESDVANVDGSNQNLPIGKNLEVSTRKDSSLAKENMGSSQLRPKSRTWTRLNKRLDKSVSREVIEEMCSKRKSPSHFFHMIS